MSLYTCRRLCSEYIDFDVNLRLEVLSQYLCWEERIEGFKLFAPALLCSAKPARLYQLGLDNIHQSGILTLDILRVDLRH